MAGSLLRAVGLPELITLRWPSTKRWRCGWPAIRAAARLRDRLERNRLTAPLFDSERYARNIEAAYAHMAHLSAAGRPPEAFAVADLLREDEALATPGG